MIITIMDYRDTKTECEIDRPLDEIERIELEIVTGDEILIVSYIDSTGEVFDSSKTRTCAFHDWGYVLYDRASGINILNDKKWLSRKSSYDY